jgi:CarD family transcriptional regulator
MPKKAAKKIAPKKVAAKKTKPVVTKKPVKKAAPKPVKKVAPKKVVKKVEPKKIVKKPAKKIEQKKITPAKKEIKETKKEEILPRGSLAKTILAKHSTKKSKAEKEAEEAKVEVKKDMMQKGIIVRRSDGRNKITFKVGDYAVYPSHGIGKIVDIEKTIILNQEFKCYLMYFEKEKLTIKIPMNSAEKIGLRGLISKDQMDEVFVILRSGVKKLKGMWSRRAQEYETKINSGDIILLAEVLRDLTRDIEDSERSYSERIIYETAIHRLACEYSVIYGIPFEEAKEKIVTIAKDKLGSETRSNQKDEFDEFDLEKGSDSEDDDEEENEDEEDEDEDDDFDYDDDDDDAPKKKKRKK